MFSFDIGVFIVLKNTSLASKLSFMKYFKSSRSLGSHAMFDLNVI